VLKRKRRGEYASLYSPAIAPLSPFFPEVGFDQQRFVVLVTIGIPVELGVGCNIPREGNPSLEGELCHRESSDTLGALGC